ncbi:MAG TPA: NAD(P)-binding domain-containing protein [Pyrinomonadaceae bacterium]|nr:NAD(P)-binding domain-containing protein [Pyrinomonadaceae bacterium]
MLDLLIIGAGPAGLAAAYGAQQSGLDYLVVEKGLIANTIYNYPVGLTVFSTTNELEFEEGTLKPAREKPTREELLSYYVRFALDNGLNIRTEETVLAVAEIEPHVFAVKTDKAEFTARNVLFAIGAMDHPRKLGVPGEDLPHVFDHFRETYPWVRKNALIVGGGNSAGEAALFLAEEGADTTLAIFRDDWTNNDPKQGCIKFWVKQPLEKALGEHCLRLFYLGRIVEFRVGETELENESCEQVLIPTDVVFVLIGSDADLTLLKSLGVATETGKYGEVPVYSEETFETNVPGIFVAGHFTNQRHIKGAIDASKLLIHKLAERATTIFT